MKKTTVLVLLIFAFLSSCTVQEKVSPDLFIERLLKNNSELSLDSEKIFYGDNICTAFLTDLSGERYALEATSNSDGCVKKICLSGRNNVKAESFYSVADAIVKTYAPNEKQEEILQRLFGKNGFTYYETQWYYYAFSKGETGLFFSIENKKLIPDKTVTLTLKENDIVTNAVN